MLRNPKNYFAPKDGKEVTMRDAVELVKAQCEAWDYKPWKSPPDTSARRSAPAWPKSACRW